MNRGPWGGDSQLGASNSQGASVHNGLSGAGDRKDWETSLFPQQDQWVIAL